MSKDLLKSIDDKARRSKTNRSVYIESVLRSYLKDQAASEAEMRDVQIINENAEYYRTEALDVLEDQQPL